MPLDSFDYKKLVIGTYNHKRVNNKLTPLLAQSTPGNIRRECANIFQERYHKKDEAALRAFFGPEEQGRKFVKFIEDFPLNKFKALDVFFKEFPDRGITDRNLGLLAWLIDFKYRPFSIGMSPQLTEEEWAIINSKDPPLPTPVDNEEHDIKAMEAEEEIADKDREKVQEEKTEETGKPGSPDPENSVKSWKGMLQKAAAASLVLLLSFGGCYLIRQQEKFAAGSPLVVSNNNCMYWANDHYEKIPCDTVIKNGIKLPFDENVKNLKRITNTDTITERSIGKVHYIKDSGIEFYTEGGAYPEDSNRQLKKMSSYIFEKYLKKKEDSTKKN